MNVRCWPFVFRLLCFSAAATFPLSTPAAFAQDIGAQEESEADVVVEGLVEAGASESGQDQVNKAFRFTTTISRGSMASRMRARTRFGFGS
jgi:hypothetical protein